MDHKLCCPQISSKAFGVLNEPLWRYHTGNAWHCCCDDLLCFLSCIFLSFLLVLMNLILVYYSDNGKDNGKAEAFLPCLKKNVVHFSLSCALNSNSILQSKWRCLSWIYHMFVKIVVSFQTRKMCKIMPRPLGTKDLHCASMENVSSVVAIVTSAHATQL